MKTRRKNIRPPKKARQRTDHPAGCRVTDNELAAVRADIDDLAELGGPKPSLGAYTKHALLSHRRLRRIEAAAKALVVEVNDDLIDADAPPSPIIERLQKILGAE